MGNDAQPQPAAQPGGFAMLPIGLMTIWRNVPDRFKLLLPIILTFKGADDTCFPSQTTLADLAGISRRSVVRQTDDMHAVGLLFKSKRPNPNRRNANTSCLYRFPDYNDPQVIAYISQQLRNLRGTLALASSSCDTQDVAAKPPSCDTQGVTYPCDIQGVTSPVTSRCHTPCDTQGVTVTNHTERTTGTNQKEEEGASPPVTAVTSPLAADGGLSPSQSSGAAATEVSHNTQATTSVQPKAVTSSNAGKSSSRGAAQGKATPLSDSDKQQITASVDAMRDYLLYGIDSLRAPDQGHQPGPYNWRQFKLSEELTPEAVGIANWTTEHFMGYVWYVISIFRSDRRQPLSLPDMSRLRTSIKKLLETRTKWQALEYLMHLITHFDVLICMSGDFIRDMQLDEGAIAHRTIQEFTAKFINAPAEQRGQWLQEYKTKVEEREMRLYGVNVYFEQV